MDVSHIILLTNITAIVVYSIIFIVMLMLGYVARAHELYNRAIDNDFDEYAGLAWYPFASSVTMAKLAEMNFLPFVISMTMAFFGVVVAVLFSIIKGTVIAWLLYSAVGIYILYSALHFVMLKKYMKKFRPELGTIYIFVSSFVPLFKYLIHINIKSNIC